MLKVNGSTLRSSYYVDNIPTQLLNDLNKCPLSLFTHWGALTDALGVYYDVDGMSEKVVLRKVGLSSQT